MTTSLQEIVGLYDANLPLAEASTIPAPWYTDAGIADLERRTVLGLRRVMRASVAIEGHAPPSPSWSAIASSTRRAEASAWL